MAITTGLVVANLYYIQPLIILVAKAFHVAEARAGVATYLTQAGYAVGLFFLVPLGDKVNRKKQIIACTMLAVVALLLAAVSKSFPLFLGACFLVGFASVVPQMILPLAASMASPEQRGQVIGIVMSGLLIGILLSRTLSGAVGDWLGWRAMFYIAAGICVLLLLIQTRFPNTKPGFTGSYGQLLGSLFTLVKTQPLLREASGINFMCFAVFGAFWTTIVLHLSAAPFGYNSSQIGLLGIAGASGALAAPLVGKFASKQNPRTTIAAGIAIMLVSILLMYGVRYSIAGIVAGIILLDAGQQVVHVTNQTRIYAIMPEARNRLNTVFMACSFVGTASGSALGLSMWQWKGWFGVCLACVCLLVAASFIYLNTKKYHRLQVA